MTTLSVEFLALCVLLGAAGFGIGYAYEAWRRRTGDPK